MLAKTLRIGIICFSLSAPLPVASELTECNGVWSNKPCEGQAGQKLSEMKSTSAAEPAAPNSASKEKQEAISEFERFIFDASRKLDQEIKSEHVISFCNTDSTSLEDCQQQIEQSRLEIQELLAKAEPSPVPETVILDNRHNTNVVVIQDNTHFHGHPRPSSTRYPLSPDFKPGPFGRELPVKPLSGKLK